MQDIYNSHTPACFVIIGDQIVTAQDFNCVSTTRGEAGSATVKIALEAIDSSVFADSSITKNNFGVEIWAGYLTDGQDPNKQLNEVFREIKTKNSSRRFTKRFDGYILQPEWSFGDSKTLKLSCLDWTGFLREFRFVRNLEGGATELRNIVKMINDDIDGINIVMDKYSGSIKLGEIDNEDNRVVCHSVGKSYYELLDDVAKKAGLIIVPDGKTIYLTKRKSNPMLWDMYYGDMSKQKSAGAAIGQHFNNLAFRYGAKGRSDKSNVVVEVLGMHYNKKKGGGFSEKGKRVRAIYPDDVAIFENTKFERITITENLTEQQAKIIAETKYRELASRLITGTIELRFANPFMSLQDIVTFVPDEKEKELKFMEGMWFSVNSITDNFGMNGYTQTIEFDSDPTLDNTPKKKVAPPSPKKKK